MEVSGGMLLVNHQRVLWVIELQQTLSGCSYWRISCSGVGLRLAEADRNTKVSDGRLFHAVAEASAAAPLAARLL